MPSVTVTTNANIALLKYWGKRDENLFLPTKSSCALTVSELKTTTTLSFSAELMKDTIAINEHPATEKSHTSIVRFLDQFRKQNRINNYFTITTHNNFPTAAGLASSSSGFAALAIGLNKLCELKKPMSEVSILARQGSGSAARSVYGGFTLWHQGQRPDGSDSYAEQLFDEHHWPELRIIIAVVSNQEKEISSRDGMCMTIATSPYYQQWLNESAQRTISLVEAFKNKDLHHLGMLVEADWTGMHQSMTTTQPSLNYWTQASYAIINTVKQLRSQNIACYFTTDAGPHVIMLCTAKDVEKIKSLLNDIDEVINVMTCTIAGDPIIHI